MYNICIYYIFIYVLYMYIVESIANRCTHIDTIVLIYNNTAHIYIYAHVLYIYICIHV